MGKRKNEEDWDGLFQFQTRAGWPHLGEIRTDTSKWRGRLLFG